MANPSAWPRIRKRLRREHDTPDDPFARLQAERRLAEGQARFVRAAPMPLKEALSAGRMTPLRRIALQYGLRKADIMALSGQSEVVVKRLMNADAKLENVSIGALICIAHAVGVAPTELLPALKLAPSRTLAGVSADTLERMKAEAVLHARRKRWGGTAARQTIAERVARSAASASDA